MKKTAIFLALFFCSSIAWADSEIKIPAPKDQQAMYDMAWDAAIDTLFELGLPIVFMSRPDGYMVTDRGMLEEGLDLGSYSSSSVRVTMRFVRTNDSINVKVSSRVETMSSKTSEILKTTFYLLDIEGPLTQLEKAIGDMISSRLKPVEGTK